jgi:hypothetical protein
MDILSMGNMAHVSVHRPSWLVILCMTTEKIPHRGASGHERMVRPRSGLALNREKRLLLETSTAKRNPFRMVAMIDRR